MGGEKKGHRGHLDFEEKSGHKHHHMVRLKRETPHTVEKKGDRLRFT